LVAFSHKGFSLSDAYPAAYQSFLMVYVGPSIKGIFERFILAPQALFSGDPGRIRTCDPQLRRLTA